jgi:hypothetical protein
MRKRMLENVRRFEAGEPLMARDPSIPFDRLIAEQRLVPIDEPWQVVGAYEETAPARA